MLSIIMAIADDNDRSFVEGLYLKYAKRLYLVAFGILNKHEDAEDCVNETVSIIIDNIERFKSADGDYLVKLLVICCRNVALNIYREKQKRNVYSLTASNGEDENAGQEYDIPDNDADVERLIISEYNCQLLHSLIEKLDVKYRDTIILKYYYSMSNEEIAGIIKISEAGVRMRLSRARKILLKSGGDELYDIFKGR